MDYLVTRMRENGQALTQQAIRSAAPVKGRLTVVQQDVPALGRLGLVANVLSQYPKEPPLLPALIDVKMAWMNGSGFVLQGIELSFDGSTAYAQGWWCRDAT